MAEINHSQSIRAFICYSYSYYYCYQPQLQRRPRSENGGDGDEINDIDEKNESDETWDWRDEFMILGSDVSALFPSLSAVNTARSVRSQIEN